MKIERTKNATRNIVFGLILKAYQILMPFIMRTALIYFLGVEYLGLNSLFTSILQVLNLAELGVGSAMVYSMYKPIVEDDATRICALMKLYRLYYRVIGCVIAIVGVCLIPFIPYLIKSDLPSELNIYILYLMNLGATVLSYWMFAYKNALFQAHQRIDVTSKIILITNTLQYFIQIIVILFTKNYYMYILTMLFTQALTNIITAIVATKIYPKYEPVGSLNKREVREINHRIRDLFTSKLGAVIVNSVDTVVISAFLGLTMLAIYQNYYFILTSVIGIVSTIFQACTAGIGNSVIMESKEKNYNDLKKFTFLIVWIAGICTVCFLGLYQPFMELWVGKELMLDFRVVICFCIYYFIYEINQLLNTYKDAAGIWHEDRFRPLITSLVNLTMNIVLVQFWGIYGVILSTVLSMLLVGMPWLVHNLFSFLFDKKQLYDYLEHIVRYTIIVFFSCLISYLLCNCFVAKGWLVLIIRGIICFSIPNLIYFIMYNKTAEFKQCLHLIDAMTNKKFNLTQKMCKK